MKIDYNTAEATLTKKALQSFQNEMETNGEERQTRQQYQEAQLEDYEKDNQYQSKEVDPIDLVTLSSKPPLPNMIIEPDFDIVLNHRVASYPNLLHLPILYNIIVGGQDWINQVAEKFPLEPMVFFHASFAIAVANSIVFLGATLKDRKVITLRGWLLLQLIVLTPFFTTILDISTFGNSVSINPFEMYAGLMSWQ